MNANFFQDGNQPELEIFEPKNQQSASQYQNFKVGNHVLTGEETKSDLETASSKNRKTKADRKVAFEQR